MQINQLQCTFTASVLVMAVKVWLNVHNLPSNRAALFAEWQAGEELEDEIFYTGKLTSCRINSTIPSLCHAPKNALEA